MKSSSRGFTLVELLIVVAILGIVAAIAVPAFVRARMSGNEGSAIGSMRAITSAQTSYAAAAGRGSYATLLATLANACPTGAQGFISPDLAQDPVDKSGFRITLATGTGATPGLPDCNGNATTSGYYATAVPTQLGITGHRSFAVTGTGAIFYSIGGAPPTEAQMAPGGGGTVVQ